MRLDTDELRPAGGGGVTSGCGEKRDIIRGGHGRQKIRPPPPRLQLSDEPLKLRDGHLPRLALGQHPLHDLVDGVHDGGHPRDRVSRTFRPLNVALRPSRVVFVRLRRNVFPIPSRPTKGGGGGGGGGG